MDNVVAQIDSNWGEEKSLEKIQRGNWRGGGKGGALRPNTPARRRSRPILIQLSGQR